MDVQLLCVPVIIPRIDFYSDVPKLCGGNGVEEGGPYLTVKTTEACYEIHLKISQLDGLFSTTTTEKSTALKKMVQSRS